MKDDIARVPTLKPELGNLSKYWQEYSWETRDELFQLSDTIGSKIDIIGLRPIFRKDLPKDYIAYWEVKMNGKKGEKYLIISAGIIRILINSSFHPSILPSFHYCVLLGIYLSITPSIHQFAHPPILITPFVTSFIHIFFSK